MFIIGKHKVSQKQYCITNDNLKEKQCKKLLQNLNKSYKMTSDYISIHYCRTIIYKNLAKFEEFDIENLFVLITV